MKWLVMNGCAVPSGTERTLCNRVAPWIFVEVGGAIRCKECARLAAENLGQAPDGGFEWRAVPVPSVWHQDSTGLPFATEEKAAADARRYGWAGRFEVRPIGSSRAQEGPTDG